MAFLIRYAPEFGRQHVDGVALVLLARDDLQALGVNSVGHRVDCMLMAC